MIYKANGDKWVSLKEICEYLCVKRNTILLWIEQRREVADEQEGLQ